MSNKWNFEIRLSLEPLNPMSMGVSQLSSREVYLNGERLPHTLEEIFLTGLDIMSGTYGKNIMDIIRHKEIHKELTTVKE